MSATHEMTDAPISRVKCIGADIPFTALRCIMCDYHPPADLLQGRVILITGAGSGVGRAAARACAAHGASVVLLGADRGQLEAVYDAIDAAGHPQPALYVLDLAKAKAADYAGLANSIAKEFGRLDGLLHNAAVLPFLSRIDDYDPEIWDQVLQINLNAPFLLTQACLSLLRAAPDASVLFTSDKVGRKGRAYWGAYGVAKFGIEGLMQILADELEGSTLRVNSIDPGPVRTDLRIQVYPGIDPATWPLPEQVMAAYLYLLGPDSRGVTGEALNATVG
jgi:NAD(P)-dependent dehydrogenase (short-subunit alcohol dehydrogenase family)